MICIKFETIQQQPQRSLSSEFELVSSNWLKTRDLESSPNKTVLYYYFEESFAGRNYMGEFLRCIIQSFGTMFVCEG